MRKKGLFPPLATKQELKRGKGETKGCVFEGGGAAHVLSQINTIAKDGFHHELHSTSICRDVKDGLGRRMEGLGRVRELISLNPQEGTHRWGDRSPL